MKAEPWISPTPSVVDFVGGARRSRAPADLAAADRCDATRGISRAGAWTRRRLLLPARFALGLLRSLLRRGLRLRSFRHTALLAIRDGDLRNSAVANRHALHSDYYSTMRKTATPLNESWTGQSAALVAVPTAPTRATHGEGCAQRAIDASAQISSIRENRCAAMVFDTCTALRRARGSDRASRYRHPAGTCRRRPRRIFRPQKNFRSEPPETRVGRKFR